MTATIRDLGELETAVRRFRDERDWRRFHNPKDLAISLTLEAAELLEHFQWRGSEEVAAYVADPERKREVAAEMADILILLLSTADVLEVDLHRATLEKLAQNALKYPVERARGSAAKYDEL